MTTLAQLIEENERLRAALRAEIAKTRAAYELPITQPKQQLTSHAPRPCSGAEGTRYATQDS